MGWALGLVGKPGTIASIRGQGATCRLSDLCIFESRLVLSRLLQWCTSTSTSKKSYGWVWILLLVVCSIMWWVYYSPGGGYHTCGQVTLYPTLFTLISHKGKLEWGKRLRALSIFFRAAAIFPGWLSVAPLAGHSAWTRNIRVDVERQLVPNV